MTTETAHKPAPPTIEFTLRGQKVERKMAFGLLTVICQGFQSVSDVQMILLDVDVSTSLVSQILHERDKKGKITVENNLEELEEDALSMEDYEALLGWGYEHVMHFFMRRARVLAKSTGALAPELVSLNKSAIGLGASISDPAPAGPSE